VVIRIDPANTRWYPRQHTRKGHIDEPTWAASTWQSSHPARRVEDREHERQRREANPVLTPGMLVIFHRKPCRIVEIREHAADLWPEQYERGLAEAQRAWDRDPRFGDRPERATWRKRPIDIALVADEPGASEQHWCVPANRDWDVLPEHYMICRQCGQLPPCDDELAEHVIQHAVGQAEHLMSIQRGCCLGCGEPITHRMKATRFPGPNLWRPDLGDGSAVFHARQGCDSFTYRYREQWEAARKAEQPAGQLTLDEGSA
jgi:hypothetical protein